MEILKKKRVNIVRYRFFHLTKKSKNTNTQVTLQCLLGSHGDHSTKLFGNSEEVISWQKLYKYLPNIQRSKNASLKNAFVG